jgi:hypothetical protein
VLKNVVFILVFLVLSTSLTIFAPEVEAANPLSNGYVNPASVTLTST